MTARLYGGDCREVLTRCPDNYIDAIVTDPPYELGFMGKGWDSSGVAYDTAMWVECLRVLKPGGHLLAFGGTRTYHRMTVAIEDAGFEIRDSIHWIYGTGFPKSLDVSKAIDKAAGATREVVGVHRRHGGGSASSASMAGDLGTASDLPLTAPATPAAAEWQGWGTALKPAHEPIVVARKPLVGTVAANVLAHGTGALNVDACRVQMSERDRAVIDNMGGFGRAGWTRPDGTLGEVYEGTADGSLASTDAKAHSLGRWPANIVLTHDQDCAEDCAEECPIAEMDQQSGHQKSLPYRGRLSGGTYLLDGCQSREELERLAAEDAITPNGRRARSTLDRLEEHNRQYIVSGYTDSGGASRFFPCFRYQAKAPTSERPVAADGTKHATVKPLALMRWLVRLVTPPGGKVLDPFAGSGTTIEAALLEGFEVIGIELDPTHVEMCHIRIGRVA